ncbi:sensor histidine kinase [Algirhabdus cladophorae]|uniref:sensor histidine kinase n=1 Tax=Algirhabdus cladophorae TaxID=3377108 RepID=UPI003B846F90
MWIIALAIFAQIDTAAQAQNPGQARTTIVADGPVPTQGFIGAVEYWLDPSNNARLDTAMAQPRWGVEPNASLDFGYIKDAIWLRFGLENTSSETTEWRLHFRENFFQNFQVFSVQPDGRIEELINQTELSPYTSRPISYPELIAPLRLEPASSTTIYIRYWSGGSSELAFSLETRDSFQVLAANKTAKNFIYYGMMMLLVIASTMAFAFTRSGVFLAYGLYAVGGLLFVMHADGNTFRYLWPSAPLLNAYASLAIGAWIIFFGANFARSFLQTPLYHPIFDKMLLAVMAACVMMLVASLFADHQMLKKNFVMLALVATILFTASGLNAARTRFKEVRFYVIAWGGAVISSAIMTSRHWFGIEISEELQFDSMRVVLVCDAALMGLAIVDRFNQLKKIRSDALEVSLSEAQKALKLSTRLQELEQDYALAIELADSKERALADTFHDLRQPLHALRLNVNAMANGSDNGPKSLDIEDTFNYLEQLVQQELATATHPRAIATKATLDDAIVDVDEVMRTVYDMFLPDAQAKGIELVYEPTQLSTRLPVLPLMRIMTNLVSNAVKYTDHGEVRLFVDQDATGAWLVVQDTGIGISPAEWQLALTRSTRLPSGQHQDGSGLGLSIVQYLAKENNLAIEHFADHGTMIRLHIPTV